MPRHWCCLLVAATAFVNSIQHDGWHSWLPKNTHTVVTIPTVHTIVDFIFARNILTSPFVWCTQINTIPKFKVKKLTEKGDL